MEGEQLRCPRWAANFKLSIQEKDLTHIFPENQESLPNIDDKSVLNLDKVYILELSMKI